MGEALIIRRGGASGEQAVAPTITKVSETGNSITFTITNNDPETAIILYEVDDPTPDLNSIELATGATTNNITIGSLNRLQEVILYVTANVTGKIKSEVSQASYEALVFSAATGGTTLDYNQGGKRWRSHTFTANGNFVVNQVGNGDRNLADILVVGGGGGGGSDGSSYNSGGGGGAGGLRSSIGSTGGTSDLLDQIPLVVQSYSITIGSGGARQASGQPSSGLGITSNGGGAGATVSTGAASGGSAPASQGFGGGSGGTNVGSGGGGGAGASGNNGTATGTGGSGGGGRATLIRTGSNETRSGGGGGGSRGYGSGGGGGGGGGGVGSGTVPGNVQGNAGAGGANTGGGGGGGGWRPNQHRAGNSGGSGVVIIRYEIQPV